MRPRTLIASTLASVALAVLVPSLATAKPIAATDLVVSVTAGANDPVSGATVVARDDRTGGIVSSATITGNLGYTVIRLRPGASTQRITITATGGRSQAVGRLSADDAMSATAQRGTVAADISVDVNPASTVLAGYLDVRPGTSIAGAERTVARRLRLPAGSDVAESARFSRARFSGEAFFKAARSHGGVGDYSSWVASRINDGASVGSYADSHPVDDLPLLGTSRASTRAASPRREQGAASVVTGALGAFLKPLAEAGGKRFGCAVGLKELCPDSATTAPPALGPEERQRLEDISKGISNVSAQMETTQQTLTAVERQVADLRREVGGLAYWPEMNAVDDAIANIRQATGLRSEGKAVPDDLRDYLANSLKRLYAINQGCPNWLALVGTLPTNVVMDGQERRYPLAACAGQGVETYGLMQKAQQRVAEASRIVTAGTEQKKLDSAGEFWLGAFVQNIVASNAASAYALRPGGGSTRPVEAVDATAQLFSDVVETIDADASGAYFGTRIPSDQVLVMGATQGTIYGIGTYNPDPGNCRGNTLLPLNLAKSGKFNAYFPNGGNALGNDFGTTPLSACTPAQLNTPPPPAPGAPVASAWESPDEVPAAHEKIIMQPLRNAALCHLEEYVGGSIFFGSSPGTGAGTICQSSPERIADAPVVAWRDRNSRGEKIEVYGQLPNLQLSLKNSACAPWEIGFLSDVHPKDEPKPRDLTSAVGMECPVVDLTPKAKARTGWNCVSANPAGAVSYIHPNAAGDNWGAPFTQRRVSSSLTVLNTRWMGGYCPSWGGRLAPPGSANVSTLAVPASIICSPSLPPDGAREGPPCATTYNYSWPRGCDSPSCTIPNPWPLQRQIKYLTTYTAGSGTDDKDNARMAGIYKSWGINYKAEDWTYNNDVAGDYVVGPLYTSNAVGAYVPGTSPGGPAVDAPPRFAGLRIPGPVRDLSVCGDECTGDAHSVRVQWRAPAFSGGLSLRKYAVRAVELSGGKALGSCSTLETQCVIRNLDLSQDILFYVAATNALGAGSTVSETFSAGPGRPTLRALPGALEVRWSTPTARSWITDPQLVESSSYTATASPGGRTCAVDGFNSTTCTISGLTPGTAYTVTVVITGTYFCYAKLPCSYDLASRPSGASSPLAAVTRRPDAPSIDTAAPSAGRMQVKWRAPAFDGGSPILGYTATADPGGATCTTTGGLSCAIDGLRPGTQYSVTVTAMNAVGTGAGSEPFRRVTPALLPSPPRTALVLESPGHIQARWAVPQSNGGREITGYTVTASPGGAQCSTAGATTCTIDGLPDGTAYEVTVAATNATGIGPKSLPAIVQTPKMTVPGAPRPPVVRALPGRIEVPWSAPGSDGGAAITGYVATATPGGATCSTTGATLCTISGLDSGTTYRVAVAAINAIGTGPPSDASAAVAPQQADDSVPLQAGGLTLEPVAVPDTADPAASVSGSDPVLTGVALTPRTLVPGLGGRIAYALNEPANVTVTFSRVGAHDRQSRVVRHISAGRPGALAGKTLIRVLYSRASALRKTPGAWTLTIEARNAQGGVARTTIPIRVRT